MAAVGSWFTLTMTRSTYLLPIGNKLLSSFIIAHRVQHVDREFAGQLELAEEVLLRDSFAFTIMRE